MATYYLIVIVPLFITCLLLVYTCIFLYNVCWNYKFFDNWPIQVLNRMCLLRAYKILHIANYVT